MRRLIARILATGAVGFWLQTDPPAFAQGALQPIIVDPSLSLRKRVLQLEVVVNGEPTGAIEEFTFDPTDRSLSATRGRLRRAGIKPPGSGPDDQPLRLDALGVPVEYVEARQQLHLRLREDQRLPRDYSATPALAPLAPEVSPGFLLNYSVFGGSFRDFTTGRTRFSGANVSFDARAFSRFGVLTQSGIVGSTLYRDDNRFLRLETTYTYSDPDRLMTARAGDVIAGGLTWTRPIRLGGVQLQTDYSLRSDLITRPVPVLAGTAAVPSTVDVYINGLRTFTQNVGAGPFNISNVPYAGAGEARVVVRDASGREVEQRVQLSDPARLLRPGFSDFSVEAGYARRDLGLVSDDYDRRPLATATLRRGMTSWLTLEGHAEFGAGLTNGGGGIVTGLGYLGTLQLAAMASRAPGSATGFQLYGAWDLDLKHFHVSASTQRSFGEYEDLASITARETPAAEIITTPGIGLLPVFTSLASLKPPRALDRLSISAPLTFDKGSVSLNFIHQIRRDGVRNRLVTLSYNRPLPWRANLFATAFGDFGDRRNLGVFAGVSMPLWGGIYGTSSIAVADRRVLGSVEVAKPQPLDDNTYGWRVRTMEGDKPVRLAAASYRGAYGQAGIHVQQLGDRGEGAVTFDGSIAVMGDGVFVGNKVHSSFAVVNAGRPDVPVLQDNRLVGRTNRGGRLLVPNLRPYEPNTIAIDPANLPPNYDAGDVTARVAPHRHAGVVVDFAKRASASAALVVLTGTDGKHLPTGSRGRTAAGETFIVGYAGQAYLRGLKPTNEISVDLGLRDCRATFAYAPRGDEQVVIDKVVCQ